eukprot:m.106478 g.106478  ORF g.106478 m.106478 type:complete len:606 (+) comp15782_c0_seq1:246-2063(+)
MPVSRRSILKRAPAHAGAELDLVARGLPPSPLIRGSGSSVSFSDDVKRVEYEKPFESEEEELAWEAEQAILRAREVVARAKADFNSGVEGDLVLQVGDIIDHVLEEEGGWWSGELDGVRGVFPSTYVKFIPKELAIQLYADKDAADLPASQSTPSRAPAGLRLFDVEPEQISQLSFGELAFGTATTDDDDEVDVDAYAGDANPYAVPTRRSLTLGLSGESDDRTDDVSGVSAQSQPHTYASLNQEKLSQSREKLAKLQSSSQAPGSPVTPLKLQVADDEILYAGLSAKSLATCRQQIADFERQSSGETRSFQSPASSRRRNSLRHRDGSIRRRPSPPPLVPTSPPDGDGDDSVAVAPRAAFVGWQADSRDALLQSESTDEAHDPHDPAATDSSEEAREKLASFASWKAGNKQIVQQIPDPVAVQHEVVTSPVARTSTRGSLASTVAAPSAVAAAEQAVGIKPAPAAPAPTTPVPAPPRRGTNTGLAFPAAGGGATTTALHPKLAEVEAQPWYHGPISRGQTEALFLADNGSEGWFLVRKSTRSGDTYVLSLCFDDHLYHNQIFFKGDKFESALVGTFDSLPELVASHRTDEGGLQAALTTPCIRR